MQPFLLRLPTGDDLVEALTAACVSRGIDHAAINVIGALERATLGFYHQNTRSYENVDFPEHLEILAGMGNVSLKDGQTFVHLHLTISDAKMQAYGGHAQAGCIIFAAEALITPLEGAAPERGFDEYTGLLLWPQA